MYQIIEYLKFLWLSKNHHGVHSPFVFQLVTKCFYDRTKYPDYHNLKQYRASLLNDKSTIEISDFGSGSRVFTSNKRRVRQIAKTSGTPLKRAKLLYRMVNYLNVESILELGSSLGIGSYSMALAARQANIISVEGCPEISRFASDNLKRHNIDNVNLINGIFLEVLPTLSHNKWDLVFIDGHHHKDATLSYFNQLLPSAHNDSVFIFDDIHWSKGMSEAWETIKNHHEVTVSIDTFYWGFVFFRKEQAKEHFTIRLKML